MYFKRKLYITTLNHKYRNTCNKNITEKKNPLSIYYIESSQIPLLESVQNLGHNDSSLTFLFSVLQYWNPEK